MKIITTEIFLERSKKIHDNFYDYSKTIYKSTLENVTITCPNHGDFNQRPNNHLNNHGCPQCKAHKNKVSKKISYNDIIDRAIESHNGKYLYDGFEFSSRRSENSILKITCPIHGKFVQSVKAHLAGDGCPGCGRNSLMSRNGIKFVEKSKKIHNEKYDYSKVIYSGNNVKVEIICKKHGGFFQRPNDHLLGKGCHGCIESKGERVIAEWLDKKKIIFERQKSFHDCRNINPLKFDFYLPEMNTVIEFDGIQHFRPIVWDGKSTEKFKKSFIIGQDNDNKKNDYVKQKGINLIRIRYDDNIENKLEELGKYDRTNTETNI